MNTPAFTLESIPKELDAKGWHLEVDSSDIQVFSKKGASNVNVVGFKTVSWHPMPATKAFSILRDVCKAMELANDQYVLGETFRAWADPATEEGTLVRTSFSMPFPFAYREFLHGLHAAQPDERTYLVGYTPIEEPEIPVQKGYVRSKMHTSGQRITQLDNGMCRVEHLMVYELAGQVSKSTQDKWLKGGHVGAYLKEWRKVREVCLASSPAEIDYQGLSILAHNALETSDAWPLTKKAPQGIIKMGRFPWCPRNVVRTDLEVAAPIDKVVKILADASLEFLPQWNKEFITGEILETISTSPQKAEWLVRVQYSTPFFLDHREYIYYFSREWISENEALILYFSVHSDLAVPDGFTRALLYPTVHHCSTTASGGTLIKHLLATDLGGKLGNLQDGMLKGGLVQAHVRDMGNQWKLLS